MSDGHITVMGEPAAAGFCASLWAAAGHAVTWITPTDICDVFRHDGLRLTDRSGLDARIGAETLACRTDTAGLTVGGVVIVVDRTVAEVAGIADFLSEKGLREALVVQVMSSVPSDGTQLAVRLPNRQVLPAVLSCQIEQRTSPPDDAALWLHRSHSGPLVIANDTETLARDLDVPCLEVTAQRDVTGVLWGRCLPDLAQLCAVAAELSSAEVLHDPKRRGWVADHLQEALDVLHKADIRPTSTMGLPLALRVRIMRVGALPPALTYRLGWPEVVGRGAFGNSRLSLQPLLTLGQRLGVAMPLTTALAAALPDANGPQ